MADLTDCSICEIASTRAELYVDASGRLRKISKTGELDRIFLVVQLLIRADFSLKVQGGRNHQSEQVYLRNTSMLQGGFVKFPKQGSLIDSF